jgi:hypothetical protein
MHYQYPLESLARRRGAATQIDIAREARRALQDTDDVVYEAHGHGLAIFAANEDALEHPRQVLRDLYGDMVQVRGPKVRRLPGEPPQEPIMHVRVSTRAAFSLRVLAELRRREARIVEQCSRSNGFVVRAEAPLATLLGLPAVLEVATHGDVAHAIRLLGYAPVDEGPGPAAA